MDLDSVLQELREGPWTVVKRRDGAAVVAVLACTERRVALPLREGRNVLGRTGNHESVPNRLLEQSQWMIEIAADGARVADLLSTNGSTMIRAGEAQPVPPPFKRFPGTPELHFVPLRDRDELRSLYATFVFALPAR